MPLGTPTANGAAATSVTIPTHAVGDVLLMFVHRSSLGTLATKPAAAGTVPAWTTHVTGTNDNFALGSYSFVATATNHTSGTWTNATQMIAAVVPVTGGVGAVGATPNLSQQSVTATLIRYPALTRNVTDGTSAIVRFGARPSGAAGVSTVPTADYSLLTSTPGTPLLAAFYYLAATGNPTQNDVTGLAAAATKGGTMEITFTANVTSYPPVPSPSSLYLR